MQKIGTLAVIGAAMLALSSDAFAQNGRGGSASRRRPVSSASRPPVSPYLNLLRRDSGGAPNYHTLVRPQVDQRTTNQAQELRLNNQAQKLLDVENVLKLEQPRIHSTGIGSV